MVFSSIVFLFYLLPATLVLYYTIGRLAGWLRNGVLLAASLIFYAWGEPRYILLLAVSCFLNWGFALLVGPERRSRRFWLAAACTMNLGILFVFKYWDFTMGSINALLGKDWLPMLGLTLPIGISFYTFQAMSYVVDVYRGEVTAEKNPLDVTLYIALFPQLVAGPIVRYYTIAQQIHHRTHSWEGFSRGCARFVLGMAKKLLLANSFAIIADNIFDLTRAGHTILVIPVSLAWLGSFAYTLQIYLDFSAYSDMAIGLGQMFGFTFEENFNYPYISCSISEFWRRWHISLGTWFREYVYIPLGGSRTVNLDKTLRNMLVVWLLTGLWHGAAWTFVLWGLLNFLCLVLERVTMLEKRENIRFWRWLYTLFMVNLGWVLFRCEDFYQLQEYLGNLFGCYGNPLYSPYTGMFLREYAWVWIFGLLACVPAAPKLHGWMRRNLPRLSTALYPLGMTALLAVSVVYLSKSGYNPFIYFNF